MTETLTGHALSAETLASLRAELLDAASRPDVDPAPSARACTSPILLVGQAATVHAATGQILHTFTSADQPGGVLEVPCGNRRATVCPACSNVYAADAFQLIASGLLGGKGVPAHVADNPRLFVTFTAPSFGRVHLGPGKSGAARPCHARRDGTGCNRWHKADDPLIGTPLDPTSYDYTSAALWNASASALWARFTTNLRRDVARLAGLTAKEFKACASVVFAKVAEYQKRGNIHFHAVIRVDGRHGPGSTAPAWASLALLEEAVQMAAARSAVTTPDNPTVPAMAVEFGRQLDIRPIRTAELADGALSDRAVAGYIAKYATKSADTSGALDHPIYCRACAGCGLAGVGTVRCPTCFGTGLGFDPADLNITDHIRTLIMTAHQLGGLPELAPLKLRRWSHMLGFRGHFLTKARAYSTSFAALREARREHNRTETREYLAAFGLLDADTPDDGETLVVASWTYAGRGNALSDLISPVGAP